MYLSSLIFVMNYEVSILDLSTSALARNSKWYWNMVCFYWLLITLRPLFLCFGYLSPRVDCCVQLQYDLSVEGSRWFLGVISSQFFKDVMKSGLGQHALAREVHTWPSQGVHRRGRSMPRPLHVVPGASESAVGFGSLSRLTYRHFCWCGDVHRCCPVAMDGDRVSSTTPEERCRELRGPGTIWTVLEWTSVRSDITRLSIADWGTWRHSTRELFINIEIYAETTTTVCPSPRLVAEGPESMTIALRVGIV